jgi:hypothetical protein
MKSVVGRRVFVGSVVAGLPAVAIGARALAQSRGAGGAAGSTHQHPAGAVDPVYEHLFHEMAAVHNRMRQEVRGEDVRALAAQLRMLAVYGRTQDHDVRIKAGLRHVIDRDGRHTLLTREPDLQALQTEIEPYRLRLDSRWRTFFGPSDPRRRSAVLDRVLTEGVTPRWERLAALLEQAAPQIDRRNGTIARVALSRQDAEWYAGFCAQLQKELDDVQDVLAVFCGMYAIVGIYAKYQCVAVSLAYFSLMTIQIANC